MKDEKNKHNKLVSSNKFEELSSLMKYENDFRDKYSNEYDIRLAGNFGGLSLRYVYFYEKDKTLLISNTSNGNVHLINLQTGSFRTFANHRTTVRKIAVLNNDIITSSWDGTICFSNYYSLKPVKILKDKYMGRCPYFNVTPDKRFLLSFTYDSDKIPEESGNVLRKWSLKTGKVLKNVKASDEMYSSCKSGAVLIHRNRIYTCSDSGYFRVFDGRTYDLIYNKPDGPNFRTMVSLFDYNYILASDWSGNIHFFNIRTNRFDARIKSHNGDVYCVRRHPVIPDIVITSSSNGSIRFWKMPGFLEVNYIHTQKPDLWSMAFINDHLAVGNIDGEVMVYDISDPGNVHYKGKISLSQHSFVAQPVNSNLFFTNNKSKLEVRRKSDNSRILGKEAEYVLDKQNDLKAFKELFGLKNDEEALYNKNIRFIPQFSENAY